MPRSTKRTTTIAALVGTALALASSAAEATTPYAYPPYGYDVPPVYGSLEFDDGWGWGWDHRWHHGWHHVGGPGWAHGFGHVGGHGFGGHGR
jgi:Spy/CpxP family protein refolding chaperone